VSVLKYFMMSAAPMQIPASKSSMITSCILLSDVKSSRPKWPRDQNFGLGLEALVSVSASASKLWPRPCLDLVVLLRNRAFFGQSVILKDAGTTGRGQ